MTKAAILKIVNPILGAAVILQALSAFLMKYAIGGESIVEIHELNGFVILAIVVCHLFLNWSWIKSAYFNRSMKKR